MLEHTNAISFAAKDFHLHNKGSEICTGQIFPVPPGVYQEFPKRQQDVFVEWTGLMVTVEHKRQAMP